MGDCTSAYQTELEPLCSNIFDPTGKLFILAKNKYRIYHVYEEYKHRYTPLDGLAEAIAEGKQPSGVYRVYTPSRRGISGLYNI